MNSNSKLILLAIATAVLIALGVGAVRGMASLKAESEARKSESALSAAL